MASVSAQVLVPPERVFAALIDPSTYPSWLAGCRTIRAVDDDWPAPGSRFHHRVGVVGPLTLPDHTSLVEVDDGKRLVLEVRARPLGRGRATFSLEAVTGAAGLVRTRITLDEVPLGRLAALQPLLDPIIAARDQASLERLVVYLNADGHD